MSSAVRFQLTPVWTIAALGLMSVACASGGGGAGLPSVTPPAAPAPPAVGSPSPSSAGSPSAPSSPSAPALGGEESQPGADAEATSSSAGEPGPEPGSEAAAIGSSPEAEAGATAEPASGGAPGDARTSEEKREELDGELRASLSEFDRLLLREQEKLAERAATAPPPGSAGAAGMGGGMGDEGGGEAGGQGDGGADGDENTTGDSSEFSTSEDPEHRAESAAGGEDEAGKRGRAPADVGSGNDDDIVARQLREAAMAEEDPELRGKLWAEYRAYKGLPRRSGTGDAGEDDEG